MTDDLRAYFERYAAAFEAFDAAAVAGAGLPLGARVEIEVTALDRPAGATGSAR